jgi:hypothetical protein
MDYFSFSCRNCNQQLYLDYQRTSDSGKRIPLEIYTHKPHVCPNRPPYTSESFECKECGQELYVTDSHRSKRGKYVPLNTDDDKPHDCPYRDNSIPCRKCKKPIYFDSQIISIESGKKIPLDVETKEPHQCIIVTN